MPRSVRPGAHNSLENVRCPLRFSPAPLPWLAAAEQEWHLGVKIRMKARPLELWHAPSGEITGVINTRTPQEQLQLLQPG